MLAWLAALWLAQGAVSETCLSTTFGGVDDRYAGGRALYLGRHVTERDIGIAHRTLPGGSRVLVRKGWRFVVASVIDRGPYGCVDARGRWGVCRRPDKRRPYRGCADLTRRTASILGHDGRDVVTLYAWPWDWWRAWWTRHRHRVGRSGRR